MGKDELVTGGDVNDPDVDSLTTEEGEITNETFIRATRESDTPSTSSGTYVNIHDGESKDVRGEFNGSAQFVPDKSGEYEVSVQADVRGSTTEGDQIRCRVRDATNGRNDALSYKKAAGGTTVLTFNWVVYLSAGDAYEIQLTNLESSFSVDGALTESVIKWSVVA